MIPNVDLLKYCSLSLGDTVALELPDQALLMFSDILTSNEDNKVTGLCLVQISVAMYVFGVDGLGSGNIGGYLKMTSFWSRTLHNYF